MQTPLPINTHLQLLQMIVPCLPELKGRSFSSVNFSKSYENIQLSDADILDLAASYLSDWDFKNY